MKLITSIIFLFALVLGFFGQTTTFESTDGYTLNYPSDWDVNEHYPDTDLMIKSRHENDDDLFREFITLKIESTSEEGAEEYMKHVMRQGEVGPMGGQIQASANLKGRDEVFTMTEYTKQAMFDIYNKYYVLVKGGKAYVFSYSGNGEGFNRMEDKADAIVTSFEIK